MKKIILLGVLFFALTRVGAQTLVWDIGAVETLISNHTAQYSAFEQVKNKEASISGYQQIIADKMVQIEYFESKFYNSLKSVEAVIKTGKDVIYAADIAKDIGKYQNQMITLASDDPKLIVVAAKTEVVLVSRTADMMNYIYQNAIVGTDVNLMDNKQRLDLLGHVIKELRTMRGIAYSICRQMKAAQRNGILQTLAPGTFKYKVNTSALAKQQLDDFNNLINPKN